MPVQTINDLTADQLTKLHFRKGLKANNSFDLKDDTKYAIVIIELHPTVVPGDYPTLATNIKAVAGIQDIDLLVDHQTRDTVPANHVQVAQVSANIALRDDTPTP